MKAELLQTCLVLAGLISGVMGGGRSRQDSSQLPSFDAFYEITGA